MMKRLQPSPRPLISIQSIVVWIGIFLLTSTFLFSSLAAAPLNPGQLVTATPQPTLTLHLIPTPLPAEYFRTEEQSTGILLGAVVLILIVLISALSVMLQRKPKLKH